MTEQHAAELTEEINDNPRRWLAGELGRVLGLTGADWRRRPYKTIAPIDMTLYERRAFWRRRGNERKRIKLGRQTREEYLANHDLSRTQPWLAEGICRRTWECRRKAVAQVGENKGSVPMTDETVAQVGENKAYFTEDTPAQAGWTS